MFQQQSSWPKSDRKQLKAAAMFAATVHTCCAYVHVHSSSCSNRYCSFPSLGALNRGILIIVVRTTISLLLPLALWVILSSLICISCFGKQVKAGQRGELLFWPLEDVVQLGVDKVGH